jgi:hypothetical protein
MVLGGDISDLPPVVIAHDEARLLFFGHLRLREAASRHA